MNIKVEEYKNSDRKAFSELNNQWLKEHNFNITDEDKEILKNPSSVIENGGQIFVVRDGSKTIGCVALTIQDEKGIVSKLAVNVHYRKIGIATKLMEELIAFAKQKQLEKIILFTNKSKLPEAVKLYRKLNFKTIQSDQTDQRCETKMQRIL